MQGLGLTVRASGQAARSRQGQAGGEDELGKRRLEAETTSEALTTNSSKRQHSSKSRRGREGTEAAGLFWEGRERTVRIKPQVLGGARNTSGT